MLKVKVNHKIGDIIEHIFNGNKYLCIGYLYTKDGSLKYVCLEGDKTDWLYFLDCEVKPSKERIIGFYIDKNK